LRYRAHLRHYAVFKVRPMRASCRIQTEARSAVHPLRALRDPSKLSSAPLSSHAPLVMRTPFGLGVRVVTLEGVKRRRCF